MLKHVARIREVVHAICGGQVLAVEHRGLGDLGSPGGHVDSGGRDLEADAPLAEAAAPELGQHPAVTAPDVRDGAGKLIPIAVARWTMCSAFAIADSARQRP